MPLLLVDMLGIKSKWQSGKDEVSTAFQRFDEFVVEALDAAKSPPLAGGIDSDAAALVFDNTIDLFRVASRIYLNTFNCEQENGRYWVRGVVVPYDGEGLRSAANLAPPYGHLIRSNHSTPLLDAIAVEQSGRIKGMRLVVSSAVLTDDVRATFKVNVGKAGLHPFRQMDFSGYPEPLDGFGWEDFLWMATPNKEEWQSRVRRIRDKMRWSFGSELEAAHAAATRILFDQCRAILGKQGVSWA